MIFNQLPEQDNNITFCIFNPNFQFRSNIYDVLYIYYIGRINYFMAIHRQQGGKTKKIQYLHRK